MSNKPSPNGGRDRGGRFAKGNSGGPGNPFAKQIGGLRKALLDAVKPQDMKDIAERLVVEAKAGNIAAIKEVFDRTLGRPVEADLLVRLEQLETLLAEKEKR